MTHSLFAEPEPDESTRSNPFTPYTKVNPAPEHPVADKNEEDKGSGIDFYRGYYKGDPYAIGADYPTKDKSEEDKGSGIDFYQDYYKGSGHAVDPYEINTDRPTVYKCEDPDCYRDYAVDPNFPR